MYSVDGMIFTNFASDKLESLAGERTIAALPFGGKYRLIDFPLSCMVWGDVKTIGIITPYKHRSIIDHVGSGKPWGLDRKNGGLHILPGSAYGITNINNRFILQDIENNMIFLNRSSADYVVATAANIISGLEYEDLVAKHHASGAEMTIACRTAGEDNEYMSSVSCEYGRVTQMMKGVKKGERMFLDTFVVNRETLYAILQHYKAINFMDLFEIMNSEFAKVNVQTYEYGGYFNSIFTEKQYFDANMQLLNQELYGKLLETGRSLLTKQHDHLPTKYQEGCSVKTSIVQDGGEIRGNVENSLLSSNVVVEEGAVVKNSIVFQGCTIRKGARVENAIVDRRNVIQGNTIIKGVPEHPMVIPKAR